MCGSRIVVCSREDVNGVSSCQRGVSIVPPTCTPTPRRGTSQRLGRICLTSLTSSLHVNSKLKGERKCLFCSRSPVQHFISQRCVCVCMPVCVSVHVSPSPLDFSLCPSLFQLLSVFVCVRSRTQCIFPISLSSQAGVII